MTQKASSNEEPVYTVFDDQEIPFATLNSALTRLSAVFEKPLKGKESFPPVKLQKEHVDFLMNETCLNKLEVEALLTRAGGDLKKATEIYLNSPIGKSFKF